MNTIIDNIKNRRSIRKFKDKKIPKSTIKEIIEAGRFAPSAHNSQPWHFVVIDDRNKIKKLSDYIKNWFKKKLIWKPIISLFNKKILRTIESAEKRIFNDKDLFFYGAPVLILICAKDNKWADKDCGCAAQNMMLAARSLNIGSCWIGYADYVISKNKRLQAELKIPEGMKIKSHLVFGYTERFPGPIPRKEEDVVNWV